MQETLEWEGGEADTLIVYLHSLSGQEEHLIKLPYLTVEETETRGGK